MEIKTTDVFDAWLDGLKDRKAQARITARLQKVSRGLFGDMKAIGEGVCELREHFGPGYRIYFTRRNGVLVVVLAGGDKSTQVDDIELALMLAHELED